MQMIMLEGRSRGWMAGEVPVGAAGCDGAVITAATRRFARDPMAHAEIVSVLPLSSAPSLIGQRIIYFYVTLESSSHVCVLLPRHGAAALFTGQVATAGAV